MIRDGFLALRERHTLIDDILLVDVDNDGVGREIALRLHVVVHNIAEIVRIRPVGVRPLKGIEFGFALRMNREVSMLAVVRILIRQPIDRQCGRIVSRSTHLVRVPRRLQIF